MIYLLTLPGGGRSPITQRYQRHFNLLSIVEFDAKALEHIFGSILVGQQSN